MEKFPSPSTCRYGTETAPSRPSWWGAPELPLCNGLPCKDAICRGHRASRTPGGLGSRLGGLWAGSGAGAGRAPSTASHKMGACKGQVERQREKDRGLELPRQRDSWSCHGYLRPSLKTCCCCCPSPFPSAQEDGVWVSALCKLKVPLVLAINTRCSQHPNGLAVSRPSPDSIRPKPRRPLCPSSLGYLSTMLCQAQDGRSGRVPEEQGRAAGAEVLSRPNSALDAASSASPGCPGAEHGLGAPWSPSLHLRDHHHGSQGVARALAELAPRRGILHLVPAGQPLQHPSVLEGRELRG